MFPALGWRLLNAIDYVYSPLDHAERRDREAALAADRGAAVYIAAAEAEGSDASRHRLLGETDEELQQQMQQQQMAECRERSSEAEEQGRGARGWSLGRWLRNTWRGCQLSEHWQSEPAFHNGILDETQRRLLGEEDDEDRDEEDERFEVEVEDAVEERQPPNATTSHLPPPHLPSPTPTTSTRSSAAASLPGDAVVGRRYTRIRGEASRYDGHSLVLSSGELIAGVDMVIWATGYQTGASSLEITRADSWWSKKPRARANAAGGGAAGGGAAGGGGAGEGNAGAGEVGHNSAAEEGSPPASSVHSGRETARFQTAHLEMMAADLEATAGCDGGESQPPPPQLPASLLDPTAPLFEHILLPRCPCVALASHFFVAPGPEAAREAAEYLVYHLCVRPPLSEAKMEYEAKAQWCTQSASRHMLFSSGFWSRLLLVQFDLTNAGIMPVYVGLQRIADLWIFNRLPPRSLGLLPKTRSTWHRSGGAAELDKVE